MKNKTIRELKKDAWKIFSKWIRKRDNYVCFTCGKKGDKSMRGMHAGHFISRRHNATLFNEKNVNSQCMYCNMYDYGASGKYAQNLIKKYGVGIIDELVAESKKIKKWTKEELELIIKKYL